MAQTRTLRYRERRAARRSRSYYAAPALAKRYNYTTRSTPWRVSPYTKAPSLPRSLLDNVKPFVYSSVQGRVSRPIGVVRNASIPAREHTLAGLFMGKSVSLKRSLRRAVICAQRKIRKEVLIATGLSSGGGSRPTFSPKSQVRC